MNRKMYSYSTVMLMALTLFWVGVADTAVAQQEKVDVIIGFKQAPGAAQDAMIKGLGGVVRSHYTLIPARAVTVPAAAVAALQANPNVAYVEADGFKNYHTHSEVGELQWGPNRMDAEAVWAGNRGSGVIVADLDTGIDSDHPDLIDNIIETWSVAGKPDASNPKTSAEDVNGHGTATAGCIAAVQDSGGVVGGAPEASIIAIQVSKGSRLKLSDIVDGIELAVLRGAHVINMSFGGGYSQAEADAITAAYYDAGCVLVASAGNGSGGPVGYPAALNEVIAVSASNINDGLASFSSVGPEVELIAPGDDIYTTSLNGSYAHVDGTSFSCPFVAGVAALVLLAQGDNAAVRAHLQNTAEDIGLSPTQQGSGLVDAENAVLGTTDGDNLPNSGGSGGGGSGGGSGSVYVSGIFYCTSGGRNGANDLVTELCVSDDGSQPVSGAVVSVELSNPTMVWPGSFQTGSDGCTRPKLRRFKQDVCYNIDIVTVQATGYTYDETQNVADPGFCYSEPVSCSSSAAPPLHADGQGSVEETPLWRLQDMTAKGKLTTTWARMKSAR